MVKSDRELNCLDKKTTRLIVSANSCNDIQAFTPSTSLVDLEIQDNSLTQCSSVKWEELTHLHTIAIGDNCFTEASSDDSLHMFISLSSICDNWKQLPLLERVPFGRTASPNYFTDWHSGSRVQLLCQCFSRDSELAYSVGIMNRFATT